LIETRLTSASPSTDAFSDDEGFFCDVAQEIRAQSIREWGRERAIEIVGQSPALRDFLSKVQRVAPYHEPVLVVGESGTGKEATAQTLYLLGPRRGKPFVSVNCPQYQDGNLTVSELFGHRRGSFTGAIADRKGAFETGDGGVIFLDEIADLHMSAQVMLLRALASGEFQSLGADIPRSVNVRVVAATNRSLNKLMVGQEFRHDLYFRLRYFSLTVPRLRERGDDWLLLLDYALRKLHRKYGIEKRFSPRALDILSRHEWPGNVRQLISVATMGYALADGDTIEPIAFEEELESRGTTLGDSADDLYHRVVVEGEDFWQVVHAPFLERDLNRGQVRAFVKKGLVEAKGSYRACLDRLRLPPSHYQRFMDFLRHNRLKPTADDEGEIA
jgi:DNA-binding NtrC family response regulator